MAALSLETELLVVEEDGTIADAKACAHAILAYLGSGGSAAYRQCLSCGAVVIAQAGREWAIPAAK